MLLSQPEPEQDRSAHSLPQGFSDTHSLWGKWKPVQTSPRESPLPLPAGPATCIVNTTLRWFVGTIHFRMCRCYHQLPCTGMNYLFMLASLSGKWVLGKEEQYLTNFSVKLVATREWGTEQMFVERINDLFSIPHISWPQNTGIFQGSAFSFKFPIGID